MTFKVSIVRDLGWEKPAGWETQAKCRDAWWLFDIDGSDPDDLQVAHALELCNACPVLAQCEDLRVANAEHTKRNLVMAGRVWVGGRVWERGKPHRVCGNCAKPSWQLWTGLCSRCYSRMRRHGDPNWEATA